MWVTVVNWRNNKIVMQWSIIVTVFNWSHFEWIVSQILDMKKKYISIYSYSISFLLSLHVSLPPLLSPSSNDSHAPPPPPVSYVCATSPTTSSLYLSLSVTHVFSLYPPGFKQTAGNVKRLILYIHFLHPTKPPHHLSSHLLLFIGFLFFLSRLIFGLCSRWLTQHIY